MRYFVETGKRVMWRTMQYRCLELGDHESEFSNCEVCDFKNDSMACKLTACMKSERADKKYVYFRLEPRFRKEKKQ